jgi:hypothetical protein
MIPMGPKAGTGYLSTLVGDITFPQFMVAKAKAEKLFVDQFFANRFKGSVKVGVNA